MPKFEIRFEREVVQTDVFTRVIEAADLDDAQAKAEAMADEADRSCPDDAAPECGDDCQSWSPALVKPAADDAEIDDDGDGLWEQGSSCEDVLTGGDMGQGSREQAFGGKR